MRRRPIWTRKKAGWVTTVGNTGRERALFGTGSLSSIVRDVAAVGGIALAGLALYKLFSIARVAPAD